MDERRTTAARHASATPVLGISDRLGSKPLGVANAGNAKEIVSFRLDRVVLARFPRQGRVGSRKLTQSCVRRSGWIGWWT